MGPQCGTRFLAREDCLLTHTHKNTKMTEDHTLASEWNMNRSKLAYEAFQSFESLMPAVGQYR